MKIFLFSSAPGAGPAIVPGENFCFGKVRSLFLSKLFYKRGAGIWGSAGAVTAIFCIEAGAMGICFFPVVEAFRMDVGAHFTVKEYCFGIVSPGTAEVDACRRAVRGQAAAFKYIAVLLPFGRGGSGEVAVNLRRTCRAAAFPAVGSLCKNLTVFKIGSSAAENKVNISADKAIVIIMSSVDPFRKFFRTAKSAGFDFFWRKRAGKEGVLTAQKTAVFKNNTVTVHIKGNRLSHVFSKSCIVDKTDIFCRKIMGIHQNAVRAESPAWKAVLPWLFCIVSENDPGCLGRFAEQTEERAVNDQLFTVSTGGKADGYGLRVLLWNGKYGRLDRGKGLGGWVYIKFFHRDSFCSRAVILYSKFIIATAVKKDKETSKVMKRALHFIYILLY